MKSLDSNKIVVSVLLFLIIFFSLLLYLDFKRKIGIGDKEIIGIIRYKEKLIQRKIDGQVVWEKDRKMKLQANQNSILSQEIKQSSFKTRMLNSQRQMTKV